MKTVEQLTKDQETIHEQIENLAITHHLKKSPIYDGVGNISEYLKSPMKIMWILKEAYDINNGDGDWEAYNQFNCEESCRIPTYRGMANVMYGFLNDIYYEDQDFPKMNIQMLNLLNSIAYINVNKMPAIQETKSNDSNMRQNYELWKDIINIQINEYAPDVIIFAGTFKYFYNPSNMEYKECFENIAMSSKKAIVYHHNGKWLISVNHPSRYGEVYIDTLIDALKYVKERL